MKVILVSIATALLASGCMFFPGPGGHHGGGMGGGQGPSSYHSHGGGMGGGPER